MRNLSDPVFGRADALLEAVEALGGAQPLSAEILLGALHGLDLGVDVPAQIVHGRGKPFVLAGEAVGELVHETVLGGEQGAYLGLQGASLLKHGCLGDLPGLAFGLADALLKAVEALGRAGALSAEVLLRRLELSHALLERTCSGFRIVAQIFHGAVQLFVLAGEVAGDLGLQGASLLKHGCLGDLPGLAFGLADALLKAVEALGLAVAKLLLRRLKSIDLFHNIVFG